MKFVPCCIYSFASCYFLYKGVEGAIWTVLLAVGFLYSVRDDVEIIYVKDKEDESKTS